MVSNNSNNNACCSCACVYVYLYENRQTRLMFTPEQCSKYTLGPMRIGYFSFSFFSDSVMFSCCPAIVVYNFEFYCYVMLFHRPLKIRMTFAFFGSFVLSLCATNTISAFCQARKVNCVFGYLLLAVVDCFSVAGITSLSLVRCDLADLLCAPSFLSSFCFVHSNGICSSVFVSVFAQNVKLHFAHSPNEYLLKNHFVANSVDKTNHFMFVICSWCRLSVVFSRRCFA